MPHPFMQIAITEEGQTSVEYALVLMLTAIVIAVALGLGLTGALDPAIDKIIDALP